MRNRWFLFSVDELKALKACITYCPYKVDGLDEIPDRLLAEIDATLKEKDADL